MIDSFSKSQIVQVVLMLQVPILLGLAWFQSRLVRGGGESFRSVIKFDLMLRLSPSYLRTLSMSPDEARRDEQRSGDQTILVQG